MGVKCEREAGETVQGEHTAIASLLCTSLPAGISVSSSCQHTRVRWHDPSHPRVPPTFLRVLTRMHKHAHTRERQTDRQKETQRESETETDTERKNLRS